MKYYLLIFVLSMVMISCAKSNLPKPRYTIKGKIFMSYPSKPLANQNITLTFTAGHLSSYESIDLGTAKTDDSGYFSITYNAIDLSNRSNVDIHIFNQFLQIDGIPINQNVNKNFYIPINGKLEIYLETNKPLELNHDTLFLGHFAGNTVVIDTITTTINGLYKRDEVPVGTYTVFYGRGWNSFGYNLQFNRFYSSTKSIDVSISGDPTIDKMTINY